MLGAVALLAMQSAVPAPGSVELDLRCMILTGQLSQSSDPAEREVGEAASYYFFGRVDSRVPDEEMEDRIWRESQAMTVAQRSPTLEACGSFMEDRGRRLVEVGGRIGAREAAAGGRQ